jgi:hypothetical protein
LKNFLQLFSNMFIKCQFALFCFVRFGKNMWLGSIWQIPGSVDHYIKKQPLDRENYLGYAVVTLLKGEIH